jgi:hypothetical protein
MMRTERIQGRRSMKRLDTRKSSPGFDMFPVRQKGVLDTLVKYDTRIRFEDRSDFNPLKMVLIDQSDEKRKDKKTRRRLEKVHE